MIFVLLFFIAHPLSIFSQNDTTNILNKRISLNIKKGNLYDALIQISNKTGYNFSYNSEQISGEKKIKINVTNKPVNEILHILLSDTTFFFKTIANQIVICNKNENNSVQLNKEKLNTNYIDLSIHLKEKWNKNI